MRLWTPKYAFTCARAWSGYQIIFYTGSLSKFWYMSVPSPALPAWRPLGDAGTCLVLRLCRIDGPVGNTLRWRWRRRWHRGWVGMRGGGVINRGPRQWHAVRLCNTTCTRPKQKASRPNSLMAFIDAATHARPKRKQTPGTYALTKAWYSEKAWRGSKSEENDIDQEKQKTPQHMSLPWGKYLLPTNTQEPVSYNFLGRDGCADMTIAFSF